MADKNISTNIKLEKKAFWDEREYRPNWAGANGILGFTEADYIPLHFGVMCGGNDDPTKLGMWICINDNDLSNPASWKRNSGDVPNLSNYQEKPDGLLQYVAMYRLASPLRVRIDKPVWWLNKASRTSPNATDIFELTPVTIASYTRIDILVGDEAGQLSIVNGVQALGNPQFPAVPAGKVMLASIHLDSETVSQFRPYVTNAAILGKDNEYTGRNKFVGPVEIVQPLSVISFTGDNTHFRRFGYSERVTVNVSGDITLGLYLATNSLIELNATAPATLAQMTNGYVANMYELVNVGVANITIKNNADIKIPNGQDFVLKPGYSARFTTNLGIARLVNDGLSNVNEADLTAAKNRGNHTGSQTANTISDFVAAVFASTIAGIAAIAGTPAPGDTVAAMFGKLKYLYDNLGLLVRAIALTGVDTNLTGTPTGADTILQFAGRTINFISTINTRIRGTILSGFAKVNAAVTAADSIEGAIGKLQGQVDAFGINAEKLNVGNNDSLTGDEGGLTFLTALGRISRIPYIWWIAATRELQIGNAANPGKLTIGGTTSEFSVPANVGNGNARQVLNANQSLSYQTVDRAGTLYDSYDTAAKKRTFHVAQGLDRGFQSPVIRDQVSIVSNGAGVKVYAQTNVGQFALPMAQAGATLDLVARFKFANSTASALISGTLTVVARRVGSTVSIVSSTPTTRADTAMSGYTVGAEVIGTDIVLFFTPGGMDSSAYTGCFYQLEYNY